MKAVITKDEHAALDETMKGLYKETNGKFYLVIEGIEEHEGAIGLKSALDAERKAQAKASAELSELKKKLGDLDPDAARDALKRIKELEQQTEEGDIPKQFAAQFEKAVNARVKSMQTDWEKKEKSYTDQIAKLENDTKSLGGQLEEVTIADQVRAEAQKAGLHDWAVEDAVMHARGVYKLENGKPVPKDKDGSIIYGKKAGEAKPISEWMSDMVTAKPGWVKDSGGGGGNNNGRDNGMNKVGNKVVVSRKAIRDNPREYERVKAEAAKTGAAIEFSE